MIAFGWYQELAEVLRVVKGKVALSSYRCELIKRKEKGERFSAIISLPV